MFSYCKKTLYKSDILQNNKLAYNSYIPCQFKNYMGFHGYSKSSSLTMVVRSVTTRPSYVPTDYLKKSDPTWRTGRYWS
jgi:hypothetical protein